MNKLFWLVGLAVATTFCSCSTVPRSAIRYSPPSVSPVRSAVTASQEHVSTAQVKAASATAKIEQLQKAVEKMPELMALANAAHQDLDDLTSELLATKTELSKAQTEITALEKKIGDQTVVLNQTIDEKNAAITARDVVAKAYHRLKFMVIGLAMALTAFLIYSIFRFVAFVPPILYLLIAAPLAVGAALLFLI